MDSPTKCKVVGCNDYSCRTAGESGYLSTCGDHLENLCQYCGRKTAYRFQLCSERECLIKKNGWFSYIIIYFTTLITRYTPLHHFTSYETNVNTTNLDNTMDIQMYVLYPIENQY